MLRATSRAGRNFLLLGTLSKDDDDGSDNDGKKNEFAFFQT